MSNSVLYHTFGVSGVQYRITQQPNGAWMKQMARNLTGPFSGFLKDKRFLIHDRDHLFTKEFRQMLRGSGVKPIRTLPMAPHLNEYYSDCTPLVA